MKKFYSNYFNKIYYDIAKRLMDDPDYTILNRSDENLSELVDASFVLTNPKNCFATIRDMAIPYLEGELDFYLSGSPFLKDIVKHSKFWERVTDDHKTINSNYGKLLLYDRNVHNNTQFEYARDCLLNNRESKKAVMTIYSNENSFKSNDNPCTMYLQYMIRTDKYGVDRLHLFVKMRSSDVWYGLPYDVPFFVLMQYKMLHELYTVEPLYRNVEIGSYHHQAGSLHLYERNRPKMTERIYQNVFEDECTLINVLEEDQERMFNTMIRPRILNWYEESEPVQSDQLELFEPEELF